MCLECRHLPVMNACVFYCLQDMLVKDASLRQAASELGLKIAERFHLDNIGQVGRSIS